MNLLRHISYYLIQIETTMEVYDKTLSTITASNDKEPCSDVMLKPLKINWDYVFMKKDNHDKNWLCGHCNHTYSKINATKALAHLLSIPNLHSGM